MPNSLFPEPTRRRQIISASRRTDVPAFHAAWFMARVREGACQVRNPFNAAQVAEVSLRPEDVAAMVFWTRDARPLLPLLPELTDRGFAYYVHYTLTGYPRVLEPRVPAMDDAVAVMQELSALLGPERVIWRYDPIFFTTLTPPAYHVEHFAHLARLLRGTVTRVKVSFFDAYRGADRRLAATGIPPVPCPDLAPVMHGLADAARAAGLQMESCAERVDLTPYGILPGKCIDDALLARLFGLTLPTRKDPGQRPHCGCIPSKDIGSYNTCAHGCVYCYATR